MNRLLMFFIVIAINTLGTASACTGILKKAENGDWVFARTMEFGAQLISSDLLFIPRGISYTSNLAPNKTGAKWQTKYAYMGFGPFGSAIVCDGLNEQGLACGAFYLPG